MADHSLTETVLQSALKPLQRIFPFARKDMIHIHLSYLPHFLFFFLSQAQEV